MIKKVLLTIFVFSNILTSIYIPTTTYAHEEDFELNVGGTLEEQLAQLEAEINAIKNQKSNLQSQLDSNNYLIAGYNSQLSALYGEVELYNKDIEQTTLEIEQLEVSIKILEEEITRKQSEIKQSEANIKDLDKKSILRIRNGYKNYRLYGNTDPGTTLLVINDINSFFKDSQYKELIQSDTNDLLIRLAELKNLLSIKKESLNEDLISVARDKEVVEVKQEDLSKKKQEVDIKIAAYLEEVNLLASINNNTQNQIAAFSQDEIRKNAEAERVRQEIFNSFTPVGQGEYVLSGKYIGRQGATGWATGPHLHFSVQINNAYYNPCNYLSGGACGGNGSIDWPVNPVMYFTSGYGNRCYTWNGTPYCDFHSGIDLVGNAWNAPIYAAHDGYLFKGVDYYGALYVIICETTNCSVGLKTGYWHLSEY